MKNPAQANPKTTFWTILMVVGCVLVGNYLLSQYTRWELQRRGLNVPSQGITGQGTGSAQSSGSYPKPVQDIMDRKTNDMWKQAGSHQAPFRTALPDTNER